MLDMQCELMQIQWICVPDTSEILLDMQTFHSIINMSGVHFTHFGLPWTYYVMQSATSRIEWMGDCPLVVH